MKQESKSYFSTDIDVIFRDIDALGHVNNAVYFTYMETARTRFFMESLHLRDAKDLPFILARTSCSYKQPARFGDHLQIDVQVTRIGRKSFNLDYIISSKDRLIAEGDSVMVAYDYAKMASVTIPQNIVDLLTPFMVSPGE